MHQRDHQEKAHPTKKKTRPKKNPNRPKKNNPTKKSSPDQTKAQPLWIAIRTDASYFGASLPFLSSCSLPIGVLVIIVSLVLKEPLISENASQRISIHVLGDMYSSKMIWPAFLLVKRDAAPTTGARRITSHNLESSG